jgi:hypothetical protein
MRAEHLYGMMAVVAISWLLILGETYVFFAVVRPLGPPLHSGGVPSSVVKIAITAGLAALWVAAMFALESFYFRPKKSPTSTS